MATVAIMFSVPLAVFAWNQLMSGNGLWAVLICCVATILFAWAARALYRSFGRTGGLMVVCAYLFTGIAFAATL